MSRNTLTIFTIYEKPRDNPEGFVVRRWEVESGMQKPCEAWRAQTLSEARLIVPRGMVRMPRDPQDDPAVVESWI